MTRRCPSRSRCGSLESATQRARELSSTPLLAAARGQGDATLNTEDAFNQRMELRRDPKVLEALGRWWDAVIRTAKLARPDARSMLKYEFCALYVRVCSSVLEEDEYDEEECIPAAFEEWMEDSNDGVVMERTNFLDSIFEIADLYTLEIDQEEYCRFLNDLLRDVMSGGLLWDRSDVARMEAADMEAGAGDAGASSGHDGGGYDASQGSGSLVGDRSGGSGFGANAKGRGGSGDDSKGRAGAGGTGLDSSGAGGKGGNKSAGGKKKPAKPKPAPTPPRRRPRGSGSSSDDSDDEYGDGSPREYDFEGVRASYHPHPPVSPVSLQCLPSIPLPPRTVDSMCVCARSHLRAQTEEEMARAARYATRKERPSRKALAAAGADGSTLLGTDGATDGVADTTSAAPATPAPPQVLIVGPYFPLPRRRSRPPSPEPPPPPSLASLTLSNRPHTSPMMPSSSSASLLPPLPMSPDSPACSPASPTSPPGKVMRRPPSPVAGGGFAVGVIASRSYSRQRANTPALTVAPLPLTPQQQRAYSQQARRDERAGHLAAAREAKAVARQHRRVQAAQEAFASLLASTKAPPHTLNNQTGVARSSWPAAGHAQGHHNLVEPFEGAGAVRAGMARALASPLTRRAPPSSHLSAASPIPGSPTRARSSKRNNAPPPPPRVIGLIGPIARPTTWEGGEQGSIEGPPLPQHAMASSLLERRNASVGALTVPPTGHTPQPSSSPCSASPICPPKASAMARCASSPLLQTMPFASTTSQVQVALYPPSSNPTSPSARVTMRRELSSGSGGGRSSPPRSPSTPPAAPPALMLVASRSGSSQSQADLQAEIMRM